MLHGYCSLGPSVDQGPIRRDVLGEVGGRWVLAGIHHFCFWLSHRYCALLSESIQVKHKAKRAWKENRELLRDQIVLEKSIKETRRLCAEASMKISVATSKQHQVG